MARSDREILLEDIENVHANLVRELLCAIVRGHLNGVYSLLPVSTTASSTVSYLTRVRIHISGLPCVVGKHPALLISVPIFLHTYRTVLRVLPHVTRRGVSVHCSPKSINDNNQVSFIWRSDWGLSKTFYYINRIVPLLFLPFMIAGASDWLPVGPVLG